MDKMKLINRVLQSNLKAEDKCLLIELLMRADDEGNCWPSVERLCKARGIKYEKNFKGADVYLPAFVTKAKRGRKNYYTINTPAVEGVSSAEVIIKHTDTPAVEGVNTPAVADNTPAVEGAYTPAVEGANSTTDNTKDSSMDRTLSAIAPVDSSLNVESPSSPLKEDPAPVSLIDSTRTHTPATEGVFKSEPLEDFFADTPLDEETKRAVSELYFDPHWFPLLKGHPRAGRAYNEVKGVRVA